MTNQEVKQLVYDALFERDIWTRVVQSNAAEIRTRCPYCGDSETRLDTGHLYIQIDVTDNSMMLYHCFRCEEGGIVTESTLDDLEITDPNIKSGVSQLNKTGDSVQYANFINGSRMISFDYSICDDKFDSRKVAYLERRLGIPFTDEMLRESKVVTSLRDFLIKNDIKELMCSRDAAELLERDYVGFLSHGNSHIIFRNVNESNSRNYRWVKYPLTKQSQQNRLFYSMASEIDIFSTDTIEICLTEGMLDIISSKYNLGYSRPNSIHIAVGGKGFRNILSYLLSIGIFGTNVKVHIFADNDEEFNKKSRNPTDINFFKRTLHNIKNLYGATYIYYNTTAKDIGIPKEGIHLRKHKL